MTRKKVNPSSLLAGRSILIKKNFLSKKNFSAKIDQDFNNCNVLSCADEETFLEKWKRFVAEAVIIK